MNIDPTISHLQNTFYSNYSEIWARFGKSQIDRTATWMNKPLLEKSAFKKILVIEFGHTRIKAAAISTDVTAAQLCDIKVIADRSSDWHGKDKNNEYKLAQLFNKNHPSPISQLLNEPYDAISLSFYGPLLDRSIETHHEMWQIPQNVKECIESATHSKVVADTDSVTWALGAASFLELQNEEIAYPCMAMTLGTHIGAALIEKSEDNSFKATAVEVWIKDWVQERTRHFVQPDDKVSAPIELLELDYLSRISGGESNIDEHMKTYRPTFETHFRAFVQDAKFAMEEWLNLKDKISSVIVGGGNSRFITDGTYDGINIKALSPQYLSRLNFPSDAVIMLGCLKKVDLPDHVFSTYPHYDELMSTKIDPLNDLSNHVEVIKKKYGFSGDLQFEKKFVKDVQFVAANKFENGQKTTLGYFYQTNEDELVPILSKFGEVDILQKLASVAFNRSDFEFTSKPALIPTQSHLDYINWNGKGDAKKRYYICLNHLNF